MGREEAEGGRCREGGRQLNRSESNTVFSKSDRKTSGKKKGEGGWGGILEDEWPGR